MRYRRRRRRRRRYSRNRRKYVSPRYYKRRVGTRL
jgi:hypothetical protein